MWPDPQKTDQIKPTFLKLHVNQKDSKVLGDVFLEQISNVFDWHCVGKISSSIDIECKPNFSLEYKMRINTKSRSSRLEVFCEKVVLKNCAKFTKLRKTPHLCQSLFLNKLEDLSLTFWLMKLRWETETFL